MDTKVLLANVHLVLVTHRIPVLGMVSAVQFHNWLGIVTKIRMNYGTEMQQWDAPAILAIQDQIAVTGIVIMALIHNILMMSAQRSKIPGHFFS
jgi:uncharacterized integral membrane protein|mmetsp:Transcript_147189/g.357298  ORF Transcript_147189/g.357298 Transcript_147189/m.357298 type:complete len:94 (+) Transcript_147189:326-607(+)